MILIPLVAILFAALASLTAGYGADSIFHGRWGDVVAYMFVTVLCSYPAYLLFRAHRRIKRTTQLVGPEERSARGRDVRGLLGYTIGGGVAVFAGGWSSGHHGAAIVSAVIYFLLAPFLLAERLEPRSSGRREP